MVKINKTGNNKCWGECGERGTLLHCWWECELVQPLWKTVWRFLKVKNTATLWPSHCTAGDLPQRYRCSEMPGHLCPDVYSSNVHNSQMWKEPRCPLKDEWIKMWFIYTMEYYSAIRNDKYPPFTSTWMELEGIMLSEVSQSEKDKHHMVSFIWGI